MPAMQPRKEHLLGVAYDLFNALGYHQTGVDLIMAKSGVSKTTMYKYFPTKEALVLEVLKRRSKALLDGMAGSLAGLDAAHPAASDLDRVNLLIDTIDAWIDGGKFFGCNFIRAAAEYGAADDPIHLHAIAHKRAFQELIGGVLADLALDDRHRMAEQIMLVLDGAITAAHVGYQNNATANARAIIARLFA